MTKKVYISGKITGNEDYIQQFQDAENFAKKFLPGYEIVNPTKLENYVFYGEVY